jgi:N-acetylglucosamine kinase-like BadF-type ATPase
MNVLGIDGGGSKTRFLLVDRHNRELAQIETGPSNWLSVGKDIARESLKQGVAQLPALPGIVCGGFAGAGRPESAEFFSDTLRSLLPDAQITIETDAFIAYIGAIGVRPGVLLIAGTGSIAIGRRPDGAMIRVGGWGATFGDEGSGFWMGREAVRAALQAADRNEYPDFVSGIARSLGLKSISEVVSLWASGRIGPAQIAALATSIIEQRDEEPARRIVNDAAGHLRALTQAAEKKVALDGCPRSVVGSVGSVPFMRQLIGLEFQSPIHSPERGAVLWSRSQIGDRSQLGSGSRF